LTLTLTSFTFHQPMMSVSNWRSKDNCTHMAELAWNGSRNLRAARAAAFGACKEALVWVLANAVADTALAAVISSRLPARYRL
jgi:hypothetical protein